MGLKLSGKYEVIEVIDGDTVKVKLDGNLTNLRTPCTDTEETKNSKPLKPVTRFGAKTVEWTKKWFQDRGNRAELEYEADYKITDFFHRPLTYVIAENENYNLEAVRWGYSPYFQKYGYARGYHDAFLEAEREAMLEERGIWDDATHAGDTTRPYHLLKMWWEVRARYIQMGRDEKRDNKRLIFLPDGLDYEEAMVAASREEERVAFGEISNIRGAGPGTAIELSVKLQKYFYVYVFENNPRHDKIINYLRIRHLGNSSDIPNGLMKQNFIFVKGIFKLYNGQPEIIVNDVNQIKEEPF